MQVTVTKEESRTGTPEHLEHRLKHIHSIFYENTDNMQADKDALYPDPPIGKNISAREITEQRKGNKR